MGLYYVVLFTSGNEGMIMGDGGRFLKRVWGVQAGHRFGVRRNAGSPRNSQRTG